MPGFGDMMQKAFYLGVGLASYASEQATGRFGELQERAQKLADELVARGEMTTEEARRFVEDVVQQGKVAASEAMQQGKTGDRGNPQDTDRPKEPRRIEILDDDETPTASSSSAGSANSSEPDISPKMSVNDLQSQVAALKDELKRLRRQS